MSAEAAPRDRSRRTTSSYLVRIAAVAVVGLLVALLAYGVSQKSPNTGIDDSLARTQPAPAPDFELPVLQPGDPGSVLGPRLAQPLGDRRIALRELGGTPVILNFWASWCVPCRVEAPRLERTWRAQRSRGVLLLGLNMQDLTDDARAFMRSFHDTYPNVRDKANDVARRWGVTGLPETFFITRQGEIVGHVIGVVSESQLSSGIAALRTGRVVGALDGGEQRPTQ